MLSQGAKRLEIITELTCDEELQSELWILMSQDPKMLPEDALSLAVSNLNRQNETYYTLAALLNKQPRSHTVALLDSLEEIERSVLSMIMLGISKENILRYNYLSHIRYNQLIGAILSSGAWELFLEEEAKHRAKARTNRSTSRRCRKTPAAKRR